MRLVGSVVVKNEAERYLESCLEWNQQFVDTLFVYDDCSTDDTRDLARYYTPNVYMRTDGPSFLEHEGQYRSAAWGLMIRELELDENDWVFSFDADEFLIGDPQPVIDRAAGRGLNSVSVHIPEVWDRTEGLKIRTDGFWGSMRLPRITRALLDGSYTFRNKPMGCGSTPIFSYRNQLVDDTIRLLHFGYSLDSDKKERYDRYTGLKDHGHNPKHIVSIISNPTLESWTGEVPDYWYGRTQDDRGREESVR